LRQQRERQQQECTHWLGSVIHFITNHIKADQINGKFADISSWLVVCAVASASVALAGRAQQRMFAG
jgi:hypothetical protein